MLLTSTGAVDERALGDNSLQPFEQQPLLQILTIGELQSSQPHHN